MHPLRIAGPVVALACTLLASPRAGEAQTFNTAFGGAGYSCLNQADATNCNFPGTGGRPASYIWSFEDYWRQSITGSGLASVNALSLNLNLQDFLAAGNSAVFAVQLNGVGLGSFRVDALGDFSGTDFFQLWTPNFSPISAGGAYVVEVRMISETLPQGGGAVGLYTDGASTIELIGVAAVPEPSTYVLLATGLAGVLGAARVRRRVGTT
jgi:hypothetical protein